MGMAMMNKAELVDKMTTILHDILSGTMIPSAVKEIRNTDLLDISINWDDLVKYYKEIYGEEPRLKITPKIAFIDCCITDCIFENIDLSGSKFAMCKIKSCKFYSCALNGVKFIHSRIDELKINNSKLIDVDFIFTEINYSNISCSDLKNSRFLHVLVTESIFREVEFMYSRFIHSVLYDCNLHDCQMKYIQFASATLAGSRLNGTTELDKTSDIEKLTLNGYLHNELPIKNHFISINNIGSRSGTTYYDYENDRVICGCWRAFEAGNWNGGSLEEFEKRIKNVYPEGIYHDEYMNAIGIFKDARKRYLDSKKG